MKRKTSDYIINYIDKNQSILYHEYYKTKLTDEKFSKNFYKEALKILKAIYILTKKKSYNHLTNYNYHFLVKILNYNNFFKFEKSFSDQLKAIPLFNKQKIG